ncbi:unnamed protein product [Clonostachys rosea]|uniref:Uncharacterized protein n=1 Tax=Bionectria ochroleuca TaxID=29856 RepID=A0ABY6UCB1_BIOOC|nr:unnamed protein product [Clonostachys rosea]
MAATSEVRTYAVPENIGINASFDVHVRAVRMEGAEWEPAPAIGIYAATVNTSRNEFDHKEIGVSSINVRGRFEVKISYIGEDVRNAVVRPLALGIVAKVQGNTITFTLDEPRDVMVEINNDKWKALHLLANRIDDAAPTGDTDDVWYFGPGINQGSASANVTDGVNLFVPSGKTVYLAPGAFITHRLNFVEVSGASVQGHGFILDPKGGYKQRELGGAIYMHRASKILVRGVTSLGAIGFSLSAGECLDVHVDGYRSFSSSGNGDGVDFFCSSNILIENCFLRNSDDNIALYSHRWDWYGDSKDIIIRNCVLLPDIAHAINMGTHGNPAKSETTSNIRISNIDILDHDENQVWYQGCIAINASDENVFEDIHVEDVRVERITRGQLVNIRTTQNPSWTTAPGRAIRNITFKNLSLNMSESKIVNPSQIIGYDQTRLVENVTFENLRVGNVVIHDGMEKPKWYTTADFVPMFVNEHVKNVRFIQ